MKHDAVGKLDDPALWANSLSSQRPSVEERRDIERLRLCGRTHGAIAAALYGPDGHRLDNDLVRRLNQYVYDASTGNKYVTMALARLNDAVAEFSTGLAQGDDQTVILLRRR